MSDSVKLDKSLIYSLPKNRTYTMLEAMFSYSVDIDNGNIGSLNGYAKLWGWSRWKVKKFIEDINTKEGHRQFSYNSPTVPRQPVRFKNNNLEKQNNKRPTIYRQLTNTTSNTSIKDNIYIQFFKPFNIPDLKIEKLLKYKNQLTKKQLSTLIEKYGKNLVCDTLLAMENHIKLYTDVYLTCNNWCKRQIEKKQNKSQADINAGGTGKVVY